MIPIHKYAAYRQMELNALSRSEYRRFIKQVKSLPQFDGAGDSSDKIVFFKFAHYKPANLETIDYYKKLNETEANKCMDAIGILVNEFTNYKM